MTQRATTFTVWESALRKRIGLSPDRIRQVRREILTEGVHWHRSGKRIRYSDSGVDVVIDHLEILSEKPPEKTAVKAALTGTEDQRGVSTPENKKNAPHPLSMNRPKVTDLTVTKIPQNFHIVMAVTRSDWPCVIRVSSNRNFIPGMTVRARHVERNVFVLEGRTPRWRGRW